MLQIVKIPHPRLYQVAADVTEITQEIRDQAREMIFLMQSAGDGVGLAANQVDLGYRMFVAHVPFDETAPGMPGIPNSTGVPVVYINPRDVLLQGKPETMWEGCLSWPGYQALVRRHPIVTMTYTTLDGEVRREKAFGLLARVWLHEIDHLDGKNIIATGSMRRKK